MLEKEISRRNALYGPRLLVALLILADQVTKIAATRALKGKEAIPLIQGVLELRYLENRGAAFGIFQNGQIFFSVVAVIAILAILLFLTRVPRTAHYQPLRLLLLLVLAGAAGNLCDRVSLGYVRDFIYFSLIDFPIFNVADIYVTVATALLVILVLFYYKDEEDFAFLSAKPGAGTSSAESDSSEISGNADSAGNSGTVPSAEIDFAESSGNADSTGNFGSVPSPSPEIDSSGRGDSSDSSDQ